MKKLLLGFIGQGFVGKNLANNFERRGFNIVRYSLEKEYVNNKHKIKECDIVFIAVPTPTTPKGFDHSFISKVLPLVGKGKVAVMKSTVLPGTTKSLQKKYPKITLIHSPEFLSEATAKIDTNKPFSNIVGYPVADKKHKEAARSVLKILPKAKFSLECYSNESEIIKYTHNCAGFVQIVFFNIMYNLANKIGADWKQIEKSIKADPYIPNRYSNPVHKGGRGAGGHCFIKDFSALREVYKRVVSNDKLGINFLIGNEKKNIELLLSSKKDMDLLLGVYGKEIINKKR